MRRGVKGRVGLRSGSVIAMHDKGSLMAMHLLEEDKTRLGDEILIYSCLNTLGEKGVESFFLSLEVIKFFG
jgi:hypothetical protein